MTRKQRTSLLCSKEAERSRSVRYYSNLIHHCIPVAAISVHRKPASDMASRDCRRTHHQRTAGSTDPEQCQTRTRTPTCHLSTSETKAKHGGTHIESRVLQLIHLKSPLTLWSMSALTPRAPRPRFFRDISSAMAQKLAFQSVQDLDRPSAKAWTNSYQNLKLMILHLLRLVTQFLPPLIVINFADCVSVIHLAGLLRFLSRAFDANPAHGSVAVAELVEKLSFEIFFKPGVTLVAEAEQILILTGAVEVWASSIVPSSWLSVSTRCLQRPQELREELDLLWRLSLIPSTLLYPLDQHINAQ